MKPAVRVGTSAPGLALLLALGGCGSTAPDPAAAPSAPDTTSRSGFSYRGISHVSWWHDEYANADAVAARSQLAATGANWAGVLVTWYMDARDSNEIAASASQTPTDDALVQGIRELHALGLKVMLKPHVDVRDGTWRGAIRPSDTSAWFSSYTAFLTRYARLAQANGVEMLCVGTELATLSDSRQSAAWASVIDATRAVYGGPLTYAAAAVSAADEFTAVCFWDRLDVAGLDAYTPLTSSTNPTLDELTHGWSQNPRGEDMLAAFRNWQKSHGKPVVFTELGYRSARGTSRAPWDFESEASYDPQEQADCYEAAFRVWSQQPWMRGIFWWAWPIPPPGPLDTDYNPRDKPAESVLRSWQQP